MPVGVGWIEARRFCSDVLVPPGDCFHEVPLGQNNSNFSRRSSSELSTWLSTLPVRLPRRAQAARASAIPVYGLSGMHQDQWDDGHEMLSHERPFRHFVTALGPRKSRLR